MRHPSLLVVLLLASGPALAGPEAHVKAPERVSVNAPLNATLARALPATFPAAPAVPIHQLKTQLKALQDQRQTAVAAARTAPNARDYRGGAGEASARYLETAAGIDGQIEAKRRELDAARAVEKQRYAGFKAALVQLKQERDLALAHARATPDAREYKGGAGEASGRSLDRANELGWAITAAKHEMALIERDSPSIAGVRAPVVALKRAIGRAPERPRETELKAEIATLERRRRAELAIASGNADHAIAGEYRGGAGELRARAAEHAASLQTQIDARKKELASLR